MTLIDEFTRKCLAIRVARRVNAIGVIETLADAMLFEGTPHYIRSDNGPEVVAKVLMNGWRNVQQKFGPAHRQGGADGVADA